MLNLVLVILQEQVSILIPDDVNLPSQYLVTQSDDSSDMEDTTTTELNVDSQVNEPNTEDDLPFIDSRLIL